jgi:hypothetical protein
MLLGPPKGQRGDPFLIFSTVLQIHLVNRRASTPLLFQCILYAGLTFCCWLADM